MPTTEQAYSLRYDPETHAYVADVYDATTGQVLWTTPETTNDPGSEPAPGWTRGPGQALGALHAAVHARYPQAVYWA